LALYLRLPVKHFNLKAAYTAIACLFIVTAQTATAQTITGAWRGKIKNSNVELKIVKSGDSLVGKAYYYTSKNNYKSYSIKGYFDGATNDVVWWDDVLLEEKQSKLLSGNLPAAAYLNVADFNCPGDDEMLLDGSSTVKTDRNSNRVNLHLEKINNPIFTDDWDFVIDNYTVGANDPYIIDSIATLTGATKPIPEEVVVTAPAIITKPSPPVAAPVITAPAPVVAGSNSNIEKFNKRTKDLQTVIPIIANSIELQFYDNAAIDGDSIAIFLNGKLVREHILLSGQAQTIKLNAADLEEDNELVMVAENLGSIPPNTSYMVAIVGNKKYEARLFANENSSALIRLVKPK
jgi:hypothetical protein